jgi:hypothetical protein
MTTETSAALHPAPTASARWQFSLRSLMAVMLAVAFLSGLCRIAPQLAVCFAGMAAAPFATWRLLRTFRSQRPIGKRLIVGFTAAWLMFYLVSVGPAIAVCQRGTVPKRAFEVLYLPFDWLYRRTPARRPLGWYANFWRNVYAVAPAVNSSISALRYDRDGAVRALRCGMSS